MIIDTSLLIEFFRKKDKRDTMLFKLPDELLSISSITYYEFKRGFNTINETSGALLLNQFELIAFDKSCADEASKIYSILKKENKMIDLADLLIAATALAKSMPLATLNVKDFERIPDLKLVSNL